MILGSPSFMAPEQATDSKSTPATDVWALGAVLYFAVEGKPPFDKGQPIPTLTAVLHDEPDIDPEIAGALEPLDQGRPPEGSGSAPDDGRAPSVAGSRRRRNHAGVVYRHARAATGTRSGGSPPDRAALATGTTT